MRIITYTFLLFSFNVALSHSVLKHTSDGCLEEFDDLKRISNAFCNDYINIRCRQQTGYYDSNDIFVYYQGTYYNKVHVIFKDSSTHSDNSEEHTVSFRGDKFCITYLDLSNNEYKYSPILNTMENIETVNLTGNYLTIAELSNEYDLPSLREIIFSFNRINIIQVNKFEYIYNQLRKIDISHNYLVNIPEAIFDSFTELETLDLSYNFIDTLSILTFEGVKKLMHLNLSHNRIADINSSLFRFSNLKVLNLDQNRIEKIRRADFAKLISLEILDLSSNSILTIEKMAFENMISLNFLDLSRNDLELIDKDIFSNTSSLVNVNLAKNNFKVLPKNLFKGKSVSFFNVKENSLEGSLMRGMFEGLRLVAELDMSNQQLTSIEDFAFFGLEKLKTLLLNNNNLQTLSKASFKTLTNLEQLDLSNNKIIDISFDKDDLVSLSSFSLRNNFLKEIKYKHFQSLSVLQFLDLSNNNISQLESKSFKSLHVLINFQISNNPLSGSLKESTFDGLNSLPSLDISSSNLTLIKNSSFNDMIQLKELNMSYSKITELQYNTFSHTGAVEIIDVSHNQLKDFNVNTTHLPNLNILLLNNNFLKFISSSSFEGLSRLFKIVLSYNHIQSIQQNAFDDSDLRYLDLSYNLELNFNISTIKNMQNLLNLYLSGISSDVTFTQIGDMPLSVLQISHTGICNVTRLNLQRIKRLDSLTLSNNNITRLEVGAFSNVNLLRQLDLSFNKIKYIQPGVFKDNTLLYTLNISHNSLTTISYGIFRGLLYLHTIDMSFNNIDNLKSERFYEVGSLNVLIVDHNKISYIGAEEFAGTGLRTLSIGDNPLPCDILVNLKKNYNSLAITAIKIDESNDENIDGVTCNMGNNSPRSNLNNNPPGDNGKVLVDIRDILFNLSNKKTEEKQLVIADNNSQYVLNVTNHIERNGVKTLVELSHLNNMTGTIANEYNNTNTLLEKILRVLTTISLKKSTPIIIPKENATFDNIMLYINNIKKDLEDTIEKEKLDRINDMENKIANLNSRLDSMSTTTVKGPFTEKLHLNNEISETKSSLFTETCVALVLLILVCFILYKFYKSRMFVPTRRSSSTRQITDSMESSNL